MAKKTKEEILYPKIRVEKGVRDAIFNSNGLLINHDVLEAMDEYAQSQNDDLLKEIERLRGALRTLRTGLFKDEKAVNDFIDEALSGL